jgi:hypothetical protein
VTAEVIEEAPMTDEAFAGLAARALSFPAPEYHLPVIITDEALAEWNQAHRLYSVTSDEAALAACERERERELAEDHAVLVAEQATAEALAVLVPEAIAVPDPEPEAA